MAKSNEKILVVEDEEDIRELISYNLKREGFEVVAHETGEEGLKAAIELKPSLVLLDIMLPGLSGIEVCKKLKGDPKTGSIPIILVSAKGEETDIVVGLEIGADDYVTKPFSPKILVARAKAVLRRKEKENEPAETTDGMLEIHKLSMHPGRFEVSVDGSSIQLTVSEFKILQYLAKHPGWVFTRSQIVDAVRGDDYPVTERSIDVQVVGIRKKLGEFGYYIETVRGVGYRFKEKEDEQT